MFGKKTLVLITLQMSIIVCINAITYESNLDTVISKNKKYKIVVSPLFCNSDSCITDLYALNNSTNIDSSFMKQQLFIFKRNKKSYVKFDSIEILTKDFYFSMEYKHILSNDGSKLLFYSSTGLHGAVIDLSDSIIIYGYNIPIEFDLSPNDDVRFFTELKYGKGKAKIKVILKNTKLVILTNIYNESKKKYLTQKKIITFN